MWVANLNVTLLGGIDAAHFAALLCNFLLHGGHLAVQLCHALPLEPNLVFTKCFSEVALLTLAVVFVAPDHCEDVS